MHDYEAQQSKMFRKLIKMLVIDFRENYRDISANHHIKSHISTSYSQVRVKEE